GNRKSTIGNSMIHIALWEPQIPPNTGNIGRLCAATGAMLHLVGRLGFRLDDRALRRAGCDYWPEIAFRRHNNLDDLYAHLAGSRFFYLSAHVTRPYTEVAYQQEDCLVFGSESHGLPKDVIQAAGDRAVCIPMPAGKIRSLNLATAVGIVLYEALRQLHTW